MATVPEAPKPPAPEENLVRIPHIPLPTDQLVDYTQYYTQEPKPLEGRMYELGN